MKKNFKIFILLIICILSTACSFPFQSDIYPSWKTKGIIGSEKLEDGRTINGYQYLKMNDSIETDIFKIKVTDVKTYNEYNNYIPKENNYLIVASIDIENKSKNPQYIYTNDFPLMWSLNKEEQEYVYSLNNKEIDSNIITDKTKIDDKKTIKVVYEINKNEKGPFAINYQEIYEDDLKGVSYYFYLQ